MSVDRKAYEMPAMCRDCPFGPTPIPLRPGRVDGIKASLRAGGGFPCHKTTSSGENGEPIITGEERGCAGARLWTRRNGCENYGTRLLDAEQRRAGEHNPEWDIPYDPEPEPEYIRQERAAQADPERVRRVIESLTRGRP